MVTDTCPECAADHIDMQQNAFQTVSVSVVCPALPQSLFSRTHAAPQHRSGLVEIVSSWPR